MKSAFKILMSITVCGIALNAADANAQQKRHVHRPAVTMPHSTVHRPSVTMPHSTARPVYRPNTRPITRPVNRQPYSRPAVTMPHSTVNRPSVTMPHSTVRPYNRPRPGYGAPRPRPQYNLQRQPGFSTRRYIGHHGNWR